MPDTFSELTSPPAATLSSQECDERQLLEPIAAQLDGRATSSATFSEHDDEHEHEHATLSLPVDLLAARAADRLKPSAVKVFNVVETELPSEKPDTQVLLRKTVFSHTQHAPLVDVQPILPPVSDHEFIDIVNRVRHAIRSDAQPMRIDQGSSGSYFCRDVEGQILGVFKPKLEEPYGDQNPKWTKWIHRNIFFCCFGRSCLVPNIGYLSEAAASVLDRRLAFHIVPRTEVVALASPAFYYPRSVYRRLQYQRKHGHPTASLPPKVGSFQLFMRGFKDATAFLKEYPLQELDIALADITASVRAKNVLNSQASKSIRVQQKQLEKNMQSVLRELKQRNKVVHDTKHSQANTSEKEKNKGKDKLKRTGNSYNRFSHDNNDEGDRARLLGPRSMDCYHSLGADTTLPFKHNSDSQSLSNPQSHVRTSTVITSPTVDLSSPSTYDRHRMNTLTESFEHDIGDGHITIASPPPPPLSSLSSHSRINIPLIAECDSELLKEVTLPSIWTTELFDSFLEQFQRLVVLDYVMRNTDRGLDNWMIKYDKDAHTIRLAAIDNGLAFPFKHPDQWRSYPYAWLFLPIARHPFIPALRTHLLSIFQSPIWWTRTQREMKRLMTLDTNFDEDIFEAQMGVMRGQIHNIVQLLKRGHRRDGDEQVTSAKLMNGIENNGEQRDTVINMASPYDLWFERLLTISETEEVVTPRSSSPLFTQNPSMGVEDEFEYEDEYEDYEEDYDFEGEESEEGGDKELDTTLGVSGFDPGSSSHSPPRHPINSQVIYQKEEKEKKKKSRGRRRPPPTEMTRALKTLWERSKTQVKRGGRGIERAGQQVILRARRIVVDSKARPWFRNW